VKRRTVWILGLSIGIPVVLVAAALLVLRLSSSNPELDLASIEVKDLPDVWAQEPAATDVAEVPGVIGVPEEEESRANPAVIDTSDVGAVILPPTIEAFELPISGTLVMVNGGKPFGEESFGLTLEGKTVMLRSNGKFWFKALIATITLTYDQVLQMDSHLRPMSLASTFDAPLGFGRKMQAEFSDELAIVRSGDDVEEFSIDLERAFVLGTFSTYAVIPLLYELRQFEGEVGLETLVFGGPPNSSDDAKTDGLPETRILQIEDATIQFDGRQLVVSQYQVSGDMGTMTLFAHGVEMLGLLAGDEEESLFVYRADYFEDGFEVVDGDRLLFQ
jgi:hypothetical protein